MNGSGFDFDESQSPSWAMSMMLTLHRLRRERGGSTRAAATAQRSLIRRSHRPGWAFRTTATAFVSLSVARAARPSRPAPRPVYVALQVRQLRVFDARYLVDLDRTFSPCLSLPKDDELLLRATDFRSHPMDRRNYRTYAYR